MPRISVVVPCYRLGHLLADCVESILSQTYTDLEVLIMDDCSPDNTAEVAATLTDPRVRYVRNDPNLGHLKNYNRGLSLARGDYMWLISADDRLRRPYVAERFVKLLDARPDVGYVFCPVMKFTSDGDTHVYGGHGVRDVIFNGHDFLRTLANGNAVPAPSGLVRRSCYERISMFPLDMPFAGDWYLWSAFALFTNVAYLAEPMVGYRVHTGNMTLDFKKRVDALVQDELRVLWAMKALAESASISSIARLYLDRIAWYYATHVGFKVSRNWSHGISTEQFEQSLDKHCSNPSERRTIRAMTYAFLADCCHEGGDDGAARRWYNAALEQNPREIKTRLKRLLLKGGAAGRAARHIVDRLRATPDGALAVYD